MNLEIFRTELRNYPGITRKNLIHHVIDFFPTIPIPENSGKVIADWGEDAAVLDLSESQLLLFAADGIMKKLMDTDPFWAGYCAVLVNIHDIISMGGLPVAMVNILSISDKNTADAVLKGVNSAVEKFQVPVVGGHTHPDDEADAIAVAIIGIVERDKVIYSHTAKPGEDIIAAMDLDGKTHPKVEFSWDTTRHKSSEQIWRQFNGIRSLAQKNLVNAGKDISNPGLIGTLGMLTESSGVGAIVDLSTIQCPPDLELLHWLKMYQGMGFIVSVKPENSDAVIQTFIEAGLSASRIGTITTDRKLILQDGKESIEVFDFNVDSITGLKPDK
ncbi:MAG: methanogenesis marker 2 protein [Thermoplasmata archaeon]|nr:MAG: methanogenesis marker 2 protein [Thermoplasmata archaeon]